MNPRQLRRPLFTLTAVLTGVFVFPIFRALAQEEPLQAFSSGRPLTLLPRGAEVARNGASTLELPYGSRVEIPLPPGAYASSLQALAQGWVVAADAPDTPDDPGEAKVGASASRRHLVILRGLSRVSGQGGQASRSIRLPEPGDRGSGERLAPILLVDHGRLAGLAWLEGDAPRGLAVRAASWSGKGWSSPQWVSRPGPGSQLALTGTVLRDGSWLLAWSAFDGQDDEVVWSRRGAGARGEWSQPERVSAPNAIPDITPALAATTEGGARIAWSRFDPAGYRLLTARFDGAGWREERTLAAPGSLYPTFLEDPAGDPALLYLQVQPRAWSLLTLDAQGRIAKRALVPSTLDRPIVTFEPGGTARMRWPAAEREARVPLERVP